MKHLKMEIKKFDMVENPSHYFKGGMWCEKAIQAITSNLTGFEAVCVANIVKYLWRYKTKNGLEDIRKARKYTDMLINYILGEEKKEGGANGNGSANACLS